MVDLFQAKTFIAGDTLLREGASGDVAYMIEHGQVEVSKMVDGRKVVLNTLGPGAIVGEMALIDKAPRMATVTALGKTVALVIDQRVFDKVLADAPPVLRALVLAYTSHLRNLGSRASQLETDLHRLHDNKPSA
ncbi:MAG: cyclic nucleotide-binding domain-containing protein [Alphaproteobacteria bacterium]|nr:cyclic nucleotide-binding domain-containing protein [Alphaproteobacteria bacterium]